MKKVPELDEELKDKETENLQDIDNAGEAGKEDELLSDAEIKRIADMNLDDIIEDATSDSVSVEDLFGNGDSAAEASQENADEPVQAASQPEEKSDKASPIREDLSTESSIVCSHSNRASITGRDCFWRSHIFLPVFYCGSSLRSYRGSRSLTSPDMQRSLSAVLL